MRQVIIFTSFLFVCMLYGCAGVESGMVPMTHEKSPEAETSRGIDTDLLSRYQTKYPEDESNNIIPGGHYELFYRRNGWASLGVQEATDTMLVCRRVPKEALLLLRDLDNDKRRERIITCEKGKQIWY